MSETLNPRRAATLLLLLVLPAASPAQPAKPPTLDQILNRLEANLAHYDARLPSLFCDERVVSKVFPGQPRQDTVTDSIFRVKRVLNPDRTTALDESRDVRAVNGKPAASQDIAGPTILSGAFEGALAIVSASQSVCMNYTLDVNARRRRNDPQAPYIIRFASVITPRNSAACLLQEEGKGRAFIDPATVQIARMELTTPHHIISPETVYYSATTGDRVLSVDYAPVQLDGEAFWLPATITSTVTSGRGTFHAITWTFKATYRNFHKLEVTSRILPTP